MNIKCIEAHTSSSWCGVKVRRGMVRTQVSSSSLEGSSDWRGPSSITLALCCKILNMRHVMGICRRIVNSIRGRSQKRMFRAHLEENESDYGELLYHADVRWLSRSIFLQRLRDPTIRGKRG
ncbi:hypothetical protein TNCV_1844121 [Trichonephila clavipes]|nr:hypothetical protein TNCV_1844121 [Trichonephila clavipes]